MRRGLRASGRKKWLVVESVWAGVGQGPGVESAGGAESWPAGRLGVLMREGRARILDGDVLGFWAAWEGG